MWEKIKAHREKQATIRAEMEAIIAKASTENRALTAEEKTAFDAKEGEYKALADTITRMESVSSLKIEDTVPGNIGRDQNPGDAQNQDKPLVDRILIPATCRRHGTLKAFKGEKAAERAYLSGMFYAATILGLQSARRWCAEHGINIHANMNEGTPSAGGVLTPTETETAIIALREEYGVARRNARIVNMGSDVKDVPTMVSDLVSYWVGEGELITPSDMVFGQATLIARKLAAFAIYSSELDEDSIIDFGDVLSDSAARAFALAEDQSFFLGDGTTYGPFMGIIESLEDGSLIEAASTHTGFETLTLDDFEKCVGAIPDYPGINPKWFISKPGWAASMLNLINAGGGNTNMNLSAGAGKPMFLGYDVEFTPVLNKVLGVDASAVKCLFGDLRLGTILGNRRGIKIAKSTEFRFQNDEICMKATERFAQAITSVGTSTTDGAEAGAIVALVTPAG